MLVGVFAFACKAGLLGRGNMAETSPQRQAGRRGFTAMEMLVVLIIMSIVTVLGIDSVATFEANQRSERAARGCLAFFRYARNLALTTGKSAKVQVDTTNHTLAVYWMSNGSSWDATPVSANFVSGGSM